MMLENFMGEKNFQKGISDFLKAYEFANAATPDLWAELQVRSFYIYYERSLISLFSACIESYSRIEYRTHYGYVDAPNGLSCSYLHSEWKSNYRSAISIPFGS